MGRWLLCWVALALSAHGCGDDGATPPADAGFDGDGADAAITVDPPAPPSPPASPERVCPEGFAATADGVCDPWPAGVPTCGPAEIPVPGVADCEALGPPCPAEGEWASDLPTTGTVRFVRAGAPTGGTGTRDAPFGTLDEAARLSGAGDVIALARGTYDEAISLRGGVTLHGACAESTLIAPSFTAMATLTLAGDEVVVRNLTLSGGGSGIAARSGGGIRLENVIVADNQDFGIYILIGGTFEANGLIVRGTRPATSRGAFGRGLDLEGESTGTVSRALFEDNTDFGIFTAVDSSLTLDRVTVRGTRPQESDAAHGRALNVIHGSTLTASRSVFADSREVGVYFHGEGTTGTLEDVVIRGVEPGGRRGGAGTGTGLEIAAGASVVAGGLTIADSHGVGIAASIGATFVGEDVLIDGVGPDGVGDLGLGVTTERGSSLTLTRAIVRDLFTVGLSAKDEGTELIVTDTLISNVGPRGTDGDMGMGVGIARSAHGTLTRVRVEDTALYGLYAGEAGSRLALEDVTVTRTGTLGGPGFGALSRDGGSITGARVSLSDISEIGILVGMASARVQLEDVAIDRVTQRYVDEASRHYGAGIQVEDDGEVEIDRVEISEAAHHAVFCFGGVTSLFNLHIRSPIEDDAGELGYGLTAVQRAEVTLERTIVEGVFGAGIASFDGAHVRARHLDVHDTQSNSAHGTLGWGVVAVDGGRFELEHARLVGNREVALMSRGAGSTFIATDVFIENTRPNLCSEAGSCEGGAGFGVSALGGSVTLTRFFIGWSALGGVQIANLGSVDLENGVIANNPIGVNVQDDSSYDFSRLTPGVRFVDNQRNIDSATVPIPDSRLSSAGLSENPSEAPAF
jgi:hypothetical protein